MTGLIVNCEHMIVSERVSEFLNGTSAQKGYLVPFTVKRKWSWSETSDSAPRVLASCDWI